MSNKRTGLNAVPDLDELRTWFDQRVATHEFSGVALIRRSGAPLFRYAGGQYIYNLSTKGMATGTWTIRVDLGDGVAHAIVASLR